ncbi:MAG: SIS domain-containing protein, partial [Anaerolineae bacterium]|nr:SIS domain-containing protein [Anaerolineae bacterium]
MSPNEILAAARQVIEKESASVASLVDQLDENFVEVVQLLFNCEGHVLVAGSGTSHAVGARLAHLLSCCGTPSLFIHHGDSLHGLSGAVTAQDVIIALSKGGETTEVNGLVTIAKQRGAKIVAFTEKPNSTLGRLSDAILRIQAAPDVDPYGMIATGSSLTNA